MKKEYEMPVAEKVQFNYSEQVVASGHEDCLEMWSKPRGTGCNTTFGGYIGD